MPAPLHLVWGYFRKDAAGSYSWTDKVHIAAWCLSMKVERIREREVMSHSVDLSSLLPPPPEAVISEEDAFLLRNILARHGPGGVLGLKQSQS